MILKTLIEARPPALEDCFKIIDMAREQGITIQVDNEAGWTAFAKCFSVGKNVRANSFQDAVYCVLEMML